MSVLHGRQAELDRIDAVLAGAKAGDGSALLLVGEPGIGKTALLGAARDAADGMLVASAAGFESEAQLPFAALGEVAEPMLGSLERLPEPQRQALGAALALTPAPAVPGDRFAIFAGFMGLLRLAAEDQPLLILLDDAHWFDQPSAECFGYAARRLSGSPIAMLAAARPGEGRAALEGRIAEELSLRGLAPDAALEMLRAENEDLPGGVAEALVELAVGNPLALRELPPMLSPEQRRGLAPLDPVPAPTGVLRDAFDRRLAALSQDSAEALLVAAAAADRALAPVAGACRELGLGTEALEETEARGLTELHTDTITFSHPLLRAAVYQGASPAARRRAHQALASHSSEDARAWHLALASIGPDAAVAAALEGAGRRATARGAHSTAADAYERAARATPEDEERSRLLLLAAGGAGLGAAYDRAAALVEPVAEIEDTAVRAPARHLLALVTFVGGTRPALDNHEMLTREAGRIAGEQPRLAAIMLADAALTAVTAAECRLAMESAQRAEEILPADAGDAAGCHVQAAYGMCLALRGHSDEAAAAYATAHELLGAVHPLSPSAQSVSFSLHSRVCLGQQEVLREEALALGSTGREAGTIGLLPHYLMVAADAAYRLGDWKATMADADEAIPIAEDSGQRGPLAIALVVRARLDAAIGEEASARAALARAIELGTPPGYGAILMWAHAATGFMELGLGHPEEAIAALRESGRLADAAGLEDPVVVPWASDLVEAQARAGRPADSAEILATLESRAQRTGVPIALALAARARGTVDGDEFAAPFEEALGLLENASAPFELARTQLAYGARLHRARERVEARRRLRDALGTFEDLGARPWAERAGDELRAAGGIEREPFADPDQLTAQEVRVARAVARGATNREVAAELFLSPKTIEFHLSRVYRKLGIRSRTELAAIVAAGELDPGGEVRV